MLTLRTDVLLHLDFHPMNVMLSGARPTAILDWAYASAGDPRADLARTVSILRLAPTPPEIPQILTLMFRRLLELGWRRGYEQVAGPFGDMAIFYAAAGAMVVRDFTPKVGLPGVWLKPSDLERVRGWASLWRQRAGIRPSGP
jgi:aminoglycoside phosphotransferase (APT) family kinase protein